MVLAAVIGARSSLADHYRVESGSMEYSLMTYDRVVVNKMSYGLRIPLTTIDVFGSSRPDRGDIALFDSPEDSTTRLIKRIVAVGGDHVLVKDGRLSINGQPLGDREVEHFGDREALLNLTSKPNLNEGGGPNFEGVVPHGKVLAMGDHRGNSNDGRMFGFVDERELVGRAVAIYYRRGEGFVWKPL
jgi:signal peptidase I